MTAKRLLPFAFAIGVATAIALPARPAHALQTTCTVTNVAWATGDSGTLQVYCGGSWYFAFGSGACPNISIDARKAWQSLAQAALLSGKQIYIEYSTCTGGPGVTYLRLNS